MPNGNLINKNWSRSSFGIASTIELNTEKTHCSSKNIEQLESRIYIECFVVECYTRSRFLIYQVQFASITLRFSFWWHPRIPRPGSLGIQLNMWSKRKYRANSLAFLIDRECTVRARYCCVAKLERPQVYFGRGFPRLFCRHRQASARASWQE